MGGLFSYNKAIETPDQLQNLGELESLPSTHPAYEKIAKYVKDGSHIPPDSQLELRIHNIFQFRLTSTEGSTFSAEKGENPTLLWFKTTTRSVANLERHVDGCISFYDRLARALEINPKNIKTPHRQLVLLFSVSLGKKAKSQQIYQYWRDQKLPKDYNSVKTIGKFIPDGKTNLEDEDNSTIIPCGETIVNTVLTKFEAEYNEYIIYEINKAQLRYAVDVEIAPYESVAGADENKRK